MPTKTSSHDLLQDLDRQRSELLAIIHAGRATQQQIERAEALRLEIVDLERIRDAPILRKLKKLGLDIEDLQDLYELPVIQLSPYLGDIMEFIENEALPLSTRAFFADLCAHRHAAEYWPRLKKLFCAAPAGLLEGDEGAFVSALANALLGSATKAHIPEVISMLKGEAQSAERLLLLLILKKHRKRVPMAQQAIEEFRTHPEYRNEIASWR
jgi:hypothetical protein